MNLSYSIFDLNRFSLRKLVWTNFLKVCKMIEQKRFKSKYYLLNESGALKILQYKPSKS